MHLAYRWFTGLGFDQEVPYHLTFSENRHGRFQESPLFLEFFERIVQQYRNVGQRVNWYEEVREDARKLSQRPEFAIARRTRNKMEALFSELRNQVRLRKLRLRGLPGAGSSDGLKRPWLEDYIQPAAINHSRVRLGARTFSTASKVCATR